LKHDTTPSRPAGVARPFDPSQPVRRPQPGSGREALERLLRGNQRHAGHTAEPGVVPAQRPFAAVLGCSDARAPVETVFEQRSNDLFVVRVAGNGVGSGSLGSLRYAAATFASLRLVVVLGHSHCGAVSAAVDTFLRPRSYLPLVANYPLRSIVDAILVAVRSASLALEQAHGPEVARQPGYRDALVEASVALNACLSAVALSQELAGSRVRVLFGRYDLASRTVGLPLAREARPRSSPVALFAPPDGVDGLQDLTLRVARSDRVTTLLHTGGDGPLH
jgi:carbonic anhydrase